MGRENAVHRYSVLVCTCLLTFGSYYCFDMPSVLESQITYAIIEEGVAKDASSGGGTDGCGDDKGPFYYNLFYTVYAWCNMAMSLVAGVLVDRWGLIPCAFLFITLCAVGQILYAIGPLTSLSPTNMYVVMFAGRFIFGLGGGSITIVQNAISAYWFAGREIAMAFGFTLTVSRLGSVINFNLTTWLFNSFLKLASDNPNAQSYCQQNGTDTSHLWPKVNGTWVGPEESDFVACRTALSHTFFVGAGLVLLSYIAAGIWLRFHRAEQQSAEHTRGLERSSLNEPPPRKRMSLKDVRELPIGFWMCAIIICTFYNDIFPFMSIVKSYLTDAKNLSAQSAGSIASIVYLMSAVVSPFLGRGVDYFGRRGYLAIAGTACVLPCFLLLTYTDVTPVLPMVLLGCAYCVCAAVLWPSVQFLVPAHVVGTANGLATSLQMFGIGICNLIVGHLMSVNTTGCAESKEVDYKPTMMFFFGMGCVSVVLSVGLKVLDLRNGDRLWRGQRDKNREAQQEGYQAL